MLNQTTLNTLRGLKLTGMAEAFAEQLGRVDPRASESADHRAHGLREDLARLDRQNTQITLTTSG